MELNKIIKKMCAHYHIGNIIILTVTKVLISV